MHKTKFAVSSKDSHVKMERASGTVLLRNEGKVGSSITVRVPNNMLVLDLPSPHLPRIISSATKH